MAKSCGGASTRGPASCVQTGFLSIIKQCSWLFEIIQLGCTAGYIIIEGCERVSPRGLRTLIADVQLSVCCPDSFRSMYAIIFEHASTLGMSGLHAYRSEPHVLQSLGGGLAPASAPYSFAAGLSWGFDVAVC